jgi:hypothetical protein
MLLSLMAEIEKGGTLEVSMLAQRLKTTPKMVSVMMEHLQRSGFIKNYTTCGDACSGCSLVSACDHKKGNGVAQVWKFVCITAEER